jgi:hypothetical protein
MNDWNALSRALRDLHAALLRRARDDHAREEGLTQEIGPGELLMLATRDEKFAWLRSLSELMTDIDYLRDEAAAAGNAALRPAVRAAVEQLLTPPAQPETAGPFAQRYWEVMRQDPEVTMAHAAVRQALQGWPAPAADAPSLVEHRERITQQRRP